MHEDSKIREALAAKALEVTLPPDLLGQLHRENGQLILLTRRQRLFRAALRRLGAAAIGLALIALLATIAAIVAQRPENIPLGYGPAGEMGRPKPGVAAPLLKAEDLAAKWKSLGWEVEVHPSLGWPTLQSKRQVPMTVLGASLAVYEYESAEAAKAALPPDPNQMPIDWAGIPHFVLRENLMLNVVSFDEKLAAKVLAGLDTPPPPVVKADTDIAEGQALDIAKRAFPGLVWEAKLARTLNIIVDGKSITGPIWIAEGRRPGASPRISGAVEILYLNAVTGEDVGQLSISAPDEDLPSEAQAVVERYFEWIARGQFAEAWHLVAPDAQRPTPNTSVGGTFAQFIGQTPGSALAEITELHLYDGDDRSKWAPCMCFTIAGSADVRFEDGRTTTILLSQDELGRWRILWDRTDR